MAEILASPDRGAAMGARAREVVRREQGPTGRHVKVILEQLAERESKRQPPTRQDAEEDAEKAK